MKKFIINLILLISSGLAFGQCDFSTIGIGTFDGTHYNNWTPLNNPGTGALGTFSQDNTVVNSGTHSMKIEVTTAHNWGMRVFNKCNITLVKDNLYSIQFWVYGGNGSSIKVTLQHASPIEELVVPLTSSSWKMYDLTIKSNGNYSNGKVKFTFPETGLYYLDDITVVESVPGISKVIKPNNSNINYTGVAYNNLTDTRATFYRFPYDYARTSESIAGTNVKSANRAAASSGISIEFKTNSKSIKAIFQENQEITGGLGTLKFAVYKNGELFNTYTSFADDFEFSFDDLSGATNTWRITMPSFAQVDFLGLEIDAASSLEVLPLDDRPVYVAIGNSITHGMGQTQLSTHLTYPWIVADSLNFHLYNWGIGGSKTNESIFDNFAASSITPDVVSVLWGYNDFNCGQSPCNTDDYIINNTMVYYTNLMTDLASTFPSATIVGILPTFSNTGAYSSVRSLDYLRTEQAAVITTLQSTYDNITFFNGNDVTDAASLNDDVHLNDLGAIQVAYRLTKELIDFGAVESNTTDTLVMRSEYETVNDLIIDLNNTAEGSSSYSIVSGNNDAYYSLNSITGELTINNAIPDVKDAVHTNVLEISIGIDSYNVTVVDAFDYYITQHPEYTVLDANSEILAETGNPYTPYNNNWGDGSAVNGVDYRTATLVHNENPDSTVFIWDTPSKSDVFGGASVWSYQNVFWGERYNLREDLDGFPIKIGDIQSLTMAFDYELLFGTETYKVALNHFLNYEDYLAPFSENDGDLFMVFDQIGNYIPPYADYLTDTIIGGQEYVLLHDSTGTIQNNTPEGYQLRRAIIKNDGQYQNGTLDINAIYSSFLSRGFLKEEHHFSHIQLGIEVTKGWGAVRLNTFKMNYVSKVITGTNNQIKSSGYDLYPNPSTDRIFIKEIALGSNYQLLNTRGELIKQGTYTSNGIEVKTLSQDVYFVVIANQSWKVIVE